MTNRINLHERYDYPKHSAELRAQVVQACRQSGASVAAIALRSGLNANLVHRWLREDGRSLDTGAGSCAAVTCGPGAVAGRVQGVVAIDGKSVRGSRDGKKHPLHIVSAWASHHGMLLGQVRTVEKSNEITAIPELLKLLSIQGCIVTIDAMGCQKTITEEIVKSQADYVLSLKTNHRHLCLGVASWFEQSLADGFAEQPHSHYLEPAGPSSHGRVEQREHWAVNVPAHLKRASKAWTGLQTIAMVRRQRQIGGCLSSEDSYYISSLPLSTGAEVLAKAVRSHWAVENELHWSLDVSFKEDDCQVRKDNAPANLACIRRIALTQLKQETTKKLGIQGKRRRAGWDQGYMETVLKMDSI